MRHPAMGVHEASGHEVHEVHEVQHGSLSPTWLIMAQLWLIMALCRLIMALFRLIWPYYGLFVGTPTWVHPPLPTWQWPDY